MSNHRFDHRTKEEFAATIKRLSALESWLCELWIADMDLRGNKVKVVNYGADNSGRYLEKANDKPDYHATVKRKLDGYSYSTLVEFKSNPAFSKCTFKIDALKSCLKHDASIVLFFNVDTKTEQFRTNTDLNNVKYCIVAPCVVEQWLDRYAVKSYGINFNGGKPSIQFFEKDYEQWFEVRELLT